MILGILSIKHTCISRRASEFDFKIRRMTSLPAFGSLRFSVGFAVADFAVVATTGEGRHEGQTFDTPSDCKANVRDRRKHFLRPDGERKRNAHKVSYTAFLVTMMFLYTDRCIVDRETAPQVPELPGKIPRDSDVI